MGGETLLRETGEYYGITRELLPAAEVADLYLRVIQYGELRRAEHRMAQGQLVTRIAREKLYTHHRHGYATLREYLKAAGMGDRLVSDLVMVGGCYRPDSMIEIEPMSALPLTNVALPYSLSHKLTGRVGNTSVTRRS